MESCAVLVSVRRTRVRSKRRGPPRRGRVVDLDKLAFMAEVDICDVARFSKTSAAYDCSGRLTTHHVRDHGSPKNDHDTMRLCEGHHQHDCSMFAIERLGKVKFEAYTGLSIRMLIDHHQGEYERLANYSI